MLRADCVDYIADRNFFLTMQRTAQSKHYNAGYVPP